ncbi:RLA class I histocompatibility antigen, alpha chain 11/11-like [Hemiscyllium ocellatum]|uniref:RLA class I histocompatibility antigen, alpha chain 11/11-like n=1 Tax=Hemiscyllium ocellatum TaxID=170820 RepID=UPI002965D046|nr:RLA class I histocompatibility antigen, alpha chain 11/11-like [Hemiscyllium ocellatum]
MGPESGDEAEVECIEWLRKYLEYGQRELRVVAPIVSFIRLGDSNRLSCLVTGFYPRAIEVTLWRDGVLIDESLSTGILPNHDRTYQIRKWIEFDPEDQAEYSCQVERSGLEEKLVVIYDAAGHDEILQQFLFCSLSGLEYLSFILLLLSCALSLIHSFFLLHLRVIFTLTPVLALTHFSCSCFPSCEFLSNTVSLTLMLLTVLHTVSHSHFSLSCFLLSLFHSDNEQFLMPLFPFTASDERTSSDSSAIS